jgi:hypothetical protein
MISTMTDTPPQIFHSDITTESSATAIADEFSRRVLRYESEILEDLHRKPTECVKAEYVLGKESQWASLLKDLREQALKPGGTENVHLAWAGMRTHW